MENLAKVFGEHPSTPFMEWHVTGHDGVSERRIGPRREKLASEIGSNPDGVMFVGERFLLTIKPPFPGYIQFWNLGTSGTSRLIGRYQISVECNPFEDEFEVKEDSSTTAETGRNDILIGIISRTPVAIDAEAMGAARQTVSTRGAFGSVEEVKTVSLSDLPDSDWAWSVLETEIKR